jgi:hypothetical protein
MTEPLRLDPKITERRFQGLVIEYARLRGWLVHHTRPALRQSGGWSTPIQGDAGFPDLVLARRGALLLVELKSAKGRLSEPQRRWAEAFRGEGWGTAVQYRLWRPDDWPQVLEELG